MITVEKLNIYKYYKGDSDAFSRSNRKRDLIMKGNDWAVIEDLIQDIFLVENGFASDEYILGVNKKLKDSCDSENTIIALKELSDS